MITSAPKMVFGSRYRYNHSLDVLELNRDYTGHWETSTFSGCVKDAVPNDTMRCNECELPKAWALVHAFRDDIVNTIRE